jgi:hypothetical protein
MDQLRERLDALEHQLHILHQQSRAVQRRLRWWRGLACGIAIVGLLGWGLPLGLARNDAPEHGTNQNGLAQRVAAIENLLKHFSREGGEVFITGANLHIVNGLGRTDCGPEEDSLPNCPNGLGNLIVGYNESRGGGNDDIRTGSHNVIVGRQHNFSRFGGLVVGDFNAISGDFASVRGGRFNTASGAHSSVSGGLDSRAGGGGASVSGGLLSEASGAHSSVSGGIDNGAIGDGASVSGGILNRASGGAASISGGDDNRASGEIASVSGGTRNTASGSNTSVSGGILNTASGEAASVSGGETIVVEQENGWAAGSFGDEISGQFRSP